MAGSAAPNLSILSDDELMRLYRQGAPAPTTPAGDLSQIPDAELMRMHEASKVGGSTPAQQGSRPMQTFDLQGPDGSSYEIQAPDEASAVAAFKKLNTVPEPSGPWERYQTAQAQPRGPWEKYGSQAAGQRGQPAPPRVPNYFDQFDAPAQPGKTVPNFFDQFDTPARTGPMGSGEAFLRGAEQGATLGFGDEARGILAASPMMESVQGSNANTAGGALSRFAAWNVRNSPLALISRGAEGAFNYVTGQAGAEAKYDEAAGQNRRELAQARTEHPWATGGGEIAGGVAATLPLMAVGPAGAAPMLAQIKNGAAVGAGLGAVQGFGQGEGGVINRAENAAYGAGGGLVVWSRDLLVRVVHEPERLVRPGFADGLIGCEAA